MDIWRSRKKSWPSIVCCEFMFKIYVLVLPVGGGGGALQIFLVLRGGQRKNIITVEFLLSLPLYNK